MIFFQDIIQKLSEYWAAKGCAIQFGYDLEMGAGTFNPATFFKSLGPEPYKAAYVEPSRRPTDGRYGDNPNRLQHYFQFQVILKPAPLDIQELYLGSLKMLGLSLTEHDIRFVHDDWKSPTLGAWGMGWEVQVDGMEVSQFTYFQNMGGLSLQSITGEITYGLERLAMYLQNVDSVYDLKWNADLSYGDIYHQNEVEWSTYNFEEADVELWRSNFEGFEQEALELIKKGLPIPAYDFTMKASHAFNLLDARGVISVTERTGYINRIRALSCQIARKYLGDRKEKGFPLLKKRDKETLKMPTLRSPSFNVSKQEDFVLEIGTEELPQSFVPIGIRSLKKDLTSTLKELGLVHGSIKTYGTSRRLVAYIEDLKEGIPEKSVIKKGPLVSKAFDDSGQPTRLGYGFLSALKKESATLLEIKKGSIKGLSIEEKGGHDYLIISDQKPALSAYTLLSQKLPSLILNLDFPQKMIWSDLEVPFPRPITSLVAVHGSQTFDFSIAGISSSSTLRGHPILSPKAFPLKKAKDYFSLMKKHFVLVDPEERRTAILDQLKKIESKLKAKALEVETVLKEVLYLAEYPQLMVGSFDTKYLKAPKELLKLVMIVHQRYFPLEDSNHHLIPNFVVCLDNKPNKKIKHGHEKAITPRLADGLFVYQQDLNLGLGQMVDKLQQMTFQKELGNLTHKSNRILKHASALNPFLQSSADPHLLEKTAALLKADLASNLVFEFPELQGIIGSHYAKLEKKPAEVSKAIEEHWLPRFEEDKLPQTELGLLFALADRIDNLLSCFLTGRLPSSSSDPYALRRQTFGIIRILIEHRLHLPMHEILLACADHFDLEKKGESLKELTSFFESRLKTVLSQYALNVDEVQAVLGNENLDIYDLFLRAKALSQFKKEAQFAPFMEVFKRAKGQLNIAICNPVDPKLFQEDIERDLYEYLLNIEPEFLETLQDHQYEASFFLLSSLQPYLAKLFDQVKILIDDEKVRMNRLALLNQVLGLFNHLLDFSLVKS